MQIGDSGGAYFTAAIAIHSFNTLVLRNKLPGWICWGVVVLGWFIAVLLGELRPIVEPCAPLELVLLSRFANVDPEPRIWARLRYPRDFMRPLAPLAAPEHRTSPHSGMSLCLTTV